MTIDLTAELEQSARLGAERGTKRRIRAYKQFFSTPEGQSVLADLYEACSVDQAIFKENDPCGTAFLAGRYLIWQHMRKLLCADDLKGAAKVRNIQEIENG